MRTLLSILVVLLAAGGACAATVETRAFTLAEQSIEVDVYLPSALPPRGLAVIAHGFTRSRGRHGTLAARLAEEGFAVAVPDLPHWVQHGANADAIVALVKAVEAEHGLDARPVVLIGTSAGGLASLLASDRVPRLALWIGLDPVDTLGISAEVARNLRAPALVLRAPSGACNVGGSARRIAGWLPKGRAERIDGASHCDFEDTTNWRCESVCGPADPARQALIVDATVRAARDALPR
jgi:dienelactone hydrolase